MPSTPSPVNTPATFPQQPATATTEQEALGSSATTEQEALGSSAGMINTSKSVGSCSGAVLGGVLGGVLGVLIVVVVGLLVGFSYYHKRVNSNR